MKIYLTILCLLLWSAAAFAVKGVIINTNPGGNSGILKCMSLKLETESHLLFPGDELPFISVIPVSEGYLVEGSITADGVFFEISEVIDEAPTIISSNVSGNITIGTNKSYLVKSTGSLQGNVTVNGGVLVMLGGSANGNISIGANSSIICSENAVVTGGSFKITGGGANSVVAIISSTVNGSFSSTGITYTSLKGSSINGKIESNGGNILFIRGCEVEGKVEVDGNAFASITDCIINGNLEIVNTVECHTSNNTVSGTVNTPGCTISPRLVGNAGTGGELEIYPNPASQQVAVNVEDYDGRVQLQVVNVLGQQVFNKTVELNGEEIYSIDVSSLAKGMYKVVLFNDSDLGTGTFVKE